MSFKDHFSAQASSYASSRPHYPEALYGYLQSLVGSTAQVWEAACGSAQATVDLARRFAHVYATEPSAAALAHAPTLNNVVFAQEAAERCSLADASVDLIVVAQALHWFDQGAFFEECRRVLRPGGVLAVWCYQDFDPPDEIAHSCAAFRARIESYWPAERALVEQGYAATVWPFQAVDVPAFIMTADWDLPRLLGYLSSFSAVARCGNATGSDPVSAFSRDFEREWGDPAQSRRIRWPLQLFVRRREDRA